MKVLLLEPEKVLADSIETYLNSLRFKLNIKKLDNEEDLFMEGSSLSSYALFILNLKDPTDPHIMKFLRQNDAEAPILLILEASFNRSLLKSLYYLSYDDVILKEFAPEEIAFRVYKLCHIWNNDKFFLSKDIFFDFEHSLFVHKEEKILLGKKEALFLKYLLAKSPHIVSSDEIVSYVYHNEVISHERIRSLVRQLRAKLLPFHFIETVKGDGYKIVNTKIEEESQPIKSLKSSLHSLFLCFVSFGEMLEHALSSAYLLSYTVA